MYYFAQHPRVHVEHLIAQGGDVLVVVAGKDDGAAWDVIDELIDTLNDSIMRKIRAL